MTVEEARSERMHPTDVAWLHMDRPTNLMVVNTVLWFDQPLDGRRVQDLVQERWVKRFRRFRQRVSDPPLTVAPWTAPDWVDAPDFRVADHVSSQRLPAPGDLPTLHRMVGVLASRPLRKDRPLWELHLFEGFGDGAALLLRTHHAVADGGALVQALLSLTDPLEGTVHADALPVHDDSTGRPILPGPVGRIAQRATATASRAAAGAGTFTAQALALVTDPRKAGQLAGSGSSDIAMLRKLGFGLSAGSNRLMGPLGTDKQLAWTTAVPVEAVKAAGRATGSTVNDVLLAAVTSALRHYLLEHDALVDEVIVTVPVNLRPKDAPLPAGLGNDFGLVFVPLPTGEADEERRRARVHEVMDRIKHSREGAFIHSMLELMGQVPTALQHAWIDAFAGKASAIVTNIAGPRAQVQLAGTPVAGLMAWVPVTGPVGLGLSFVSYAGKLAVGLASDAQLLPDHDRLLHLLDDEMAAIRTDPCRDRA